MAEEAEGRMRLRWICYYMIYIFDTGSGGPRGRKLEGFQGVDEGATLDCENHFHSLSGLCA